MRTLKVDKYGSISIYNEDGMLHSFNGKPAVIMSNGELYWYEHGREVKILYSDGRVFLWK